MPPIRRPRPRTEPIVRVRTGCYTCRRRKKKCNEAKPVCSGCSRNKLSCIWPFDLPDEADISTQSTTTSNQSLALLCTSPSEEVPSLDPELIHASSHALIPCTPTDAISQSLSMLPGHDPESFQLLSHYLATTADCMANGSTPLNPFLVQIIPLAFGSSLLLQLVLTQSAAHRAFRSRMGADAVAVSHYTKALRSFRNGVAEFVNGGQSSSTLVLTTGALIMCFTETARGDINGSVFDHLAAANSLLSQLPLHSEAGAPGGLHDFLIEYYTYTAAVSMISIDARVSGQQLLDYGMGQRVSYLLKSNYVGSLCGCWLELLLIIPRIFDLRRQWMMQQQDNEMQPSFSADDLVLFGSLQAQISQWTPYASVSHETHMAGLVFKHSVLVYLLTSLEDPTETTGSIRQALVESTLSEALALLRQLPATARINSGLCWPIVVVGSCLSDPEQQDELRCRLTTMGNTFGLGNMYRTLLILEHMWTTTTPPTQAGPWNICRAMQRNQIWISFA
ncbi:fungal-specific transcription factor domain-containing protein [Aspergillus pseudoustus]|uniref:Fungal-specific transcription factor domain-containing protein n=1 Tax=Aspergillus pseudoustus TaxID=1810923 RepID=A0ABR4JC37_9EURO